MENTTLSLEKSCCHRIACARGNSERRKPSRGFKRLHQKESHKGSQIIWMAALVGACISGRGGWGSGGAQAHFLGLHAPAQAWSHCSSLCPVRFSVFSLQAGHGLFSPFSYLISPVGLHPAWLLFARAVRKVWAGFWMIAQLPCVLRTANPLVLAERGHVRGFFQDVCYETTGWFVHPIWITGVRT